MFTKLFFFSFLSSSSLLFGSNPAFPPKLPKPHLIQRGVLNLLPSSKTGTPPAYLASAPYVRGAFTKGFFVGQITSDNIGGFSLSEALTREKFLWSYKTPKGGLSTSPIIVKDSVFLAFKTGRLTKLDLKTGKELWSVVLVGAYPEGPLSFYKEMLYIPTFGGTLFQVSSKTGEVNWMYTLSKTRDVQVLTQGKLLFKQNKVFTGTDEGELLCLDTKTGQLVWSFKPPFIPKEKFKSFVGSFFIQDDTFYAARYDGYVFAFNMKSKKLKWSFKANPGVTASLFSPEDKLFYIGTPDGRLHALDQESGLDTVKKAPNLGKISLSSLIYRPKGLLVSGSGGRVFHLKKNSYSIDSFIDLQTQILSDPIIYSDENVLFQSNEKTLFYVVTMPY